jgi:hypothetical protein
MLIDIEYEQKIHRAESDLIKRLSHKDLSNEDIARLFEYIMR